MEPSTETGFSTEVDRGLAPPAPIAPPAAESAPLGGAIGPGDRGESPPSTIVVMPDTTKGLSPCESLFSVGDAIGPLCTSMVTLTASISSGLASHVPERGGTCDEWSERSAGE
tara:strand:- start:1025 stop:1363 length:339 start_codon:yes stop_codon:yes gene_type:complete